MDSTHGSKAVSVFEGYRMLAILDVDPYFADFNFSAHRDPTLKDRVTKAELYQLAYDSRNGDDRARAEFADVMYCTLRKATFECFERTHGPQAVSHAEWMHAKLSQFFRILLYDEISSVRLENGKLCSHTTEKPPGRGFDLISSSGPIIQPDEIEATFGPEDKTPS